MRILALDYGSARTGVAVCDETGTIAVPLTVLPGVDTQAGFAELLTLIEEHQPDLIVVGSPTPLAGGDNAQSRRAQSFAVHLRRHLSTPIETYDERFTTTMARARGGRTPLDARAAALILEEYLREHGPAT